ncbi:uncharacterized protein N0V96_010216 [Colletotrichum fioriniae]|uniref:uncharacterized protein n=1 Tax=Colletotrichum fioriniae TaxID=710243 RepID=UPI0032DBEFDF|nr:hypothetical protein N0V96_010216 [Colletotrichum fioriniae]
MNSQFKLCRFSQHVRNRKRPKHTLDALAEQLGVCFLDIDCGINYRLDRVPFFGFFQRKSNFKLINDNECLAGAHVFKHYDWPGYLAADYLK